MKHSLQNQLSRILSVAIVAAGLLAGALSFWMAYGEAQEFQDDTLRQIAAMASKGLLQGSDPASSKLQYPNIDPEVRVVVMTLPPDGKAAAWLPHNLKPGFQTLHKPDGDWRVFVRMKNGAGAAVAQATEARNEIAINSALRTLLPLLLLLPLLVWLAVRIVRKELYPVRALAQTLDAQPAGDPAQLPEAGCPDEIIPFIRSINQLLERTRLLMADQRRFIADAAHELRTPLTALSLQAQNLAKVASTEEMRERVAPLKEGIERSRRLTEQLLSHARNQVGTPDLQGVDVAKLLRQLIAECIPLAEAKHIDVGMEGDEGMTLDSDPQMLLLVLRNALENALRYTPEHGEVTLRYRIEGTDAVIEVADSGPGIPAGDRERVFDPFYRIAGSGGTGSGLGLAIARDAATRLGGSVSLHQREQGDGLVFRYRQPA